MQIATWNVNSLRSRLDRVLAWLERHQVDVVCLQETKCADGQFPTAELEALGYHVACSGEARGRNGVATLSRAPLSGVERRLAGRDDDEQRRFLEATTGGVRVLNVYVPNGQAIGSEAFFYKLDWLSRLQAHLVADHDPGEPLVLLGDFNITPDDRDVWDAPARQGSLHCSEFERRALGYLQQWGLQDALRLRTDEPGIYTWFDYRDTLHGFRGDRGLRIDMIYVTAPMAARLTDVRVDLEERAGEKPSDHAPVIATFAD